MKKHAFNLRALLMVAGLSGSYSSAIACDACKAQQPKFLQGVTHGAGPTSNWDYVVVSLMVVVTAYSFYALVKCMVRPADKGHERIKNMILNS